MNLSRVERYFRKVSILNKMDNVDNPELCVCLRGRNITACFHHFPKEIEHMKYLLYVTHKNKTSSRGITSDNLESLIDELLMILKENNIQKL